MWGAREGEIRVHLSCDESRKVLHVHLEPLMNCVAGKHGERGLNIACVGRKDDMPTIISKSRW